MRKVKDDIGSKIQIMMEDRENKTRIEAGA